MVYLFGLLTVFAIFLGGFVAFTFKHDSKLLISYCGGTLVAAAFLDIIPEALELRGLDDIKVFMVILISSFLVFLTLDKLFFTHGHSHVDHQNTNLKLEKKESETPKILFSAGILLHTFIDGVVIGSSFMLDGSVGILIASIILLHDFTDGISTVTIMKHHKQSNKAIIWLLLTAGCVTMIGLFFSQAFKPSDTMLSNILAVFAGLFIYIGAADLLPEAHKDRSSLKLVSATILGVATVALFSYLM